MEESETPQWDSHFWLSALLWDSQSWLSVDFGGSELSSDIEARSKPASAAEENLLSFSLELRDACDANSISSRYSSLLP